MLTCPSSNAVGFLLGSGALSDTTFTYEGTNYTIDNTTVFAGSFLIFSLGSAGLGNDAANLVLHVGTQQFRFSEATYAAGTYSYTWSTNVPTWADGDAVCLALTVDGPDVSSVALTSTPGADNTYAIGDSVSATVTFDAAVDITGSPQLELDFDGTAKAAGCTAATNTTTMACSYTVAAVDSAPNGVAIAANRLTGGTITATGSTTITADLDQVAVAIAAGHKVDGIRPTLVTTGSDAPKTSTDGTQVILTFSEDISAVSLSDIDVTANSTSGYEQGATVSRSGRTVTLTLLSSSLTIQAGWAVTVELSANAVDDAAGNGNVALAATTVTNAVGTTTAPTVTAVALTSAPGSDNTYGIGDEVAAAVTFDAAVDISAAPQLELDFDGTAKAAACATGTNTTTMVCEYEVAVGDSAPNGIAIAANKLTGGTVTATGSTTTADLDHVAVAIDAGHKVDGIRPTLFTTGPDAPTTSTDGTKVILTFSEDIGGVSRNDITIQANSVTAATSAASVTGTKVELTLTTALTTTATNLTVELAANAVFDAASNGILAVAATAVTNAVGTTVSNAAPTFQSPTETRSVAENSAVGTNVGAPVTATDTDSGDTLTYTLEGTDASSFSIASTSGQIRTRSGVTYDYETTPSYTVIVKADDNNGGTDTVTVTIDLTDVNEPPRAPVAPRVTATPDTTDSLTVSWRAPSNTGRPAIDDYDVQYREGTSGSWTNGPQNVSGTSATITGLTADPAAYQVQVRATNADGAGPWSPTGSIRTTPPPPVGPPSPPRNLTAMAADQAVQLSWSRPVDDGGSRIVPYEYRQQEGDGPVGEWQIIGENPPPTNHTVTGLTNAVSYTFHVRAVNNGGWASPPSESASATPEPEREPFEVEIVGAPEVAVAGESYELTAQSDEESLVYAWRVAYGGAIEPDDAQTVLWTAPETAGVAWIHVDVTHEDGETAGDSVYQRVVEPADLVVASLSVSASEPAAGAGFTLSATVRNAGDGAASATTLRYYQSTDATITTADTAVGTAAVAKLAAAGTRAASIDLTAPAAAGTYYYGACVDAVAEESDPTNNCSTATPNDVTPVPALPLLGQLLLALGLGAAGARVTRARQARRRR